MMNPDWDGVMKGRAREPKGPAGPASPVYTPMELGRAIALLDRVLATNHSPETWLAWCAVRKAVLAGRTSGTESPT